MTYVLSDRLAAVAGPTGSGASRTTGAAVRALERGRTERCGADDLGATLVVASRVPVSQTARGPPTTRSPARQSGRFHRVHGDVRTPASVVTIWRCAHGTRDDSTSPRSRGGPIGVSPLWNTGVISIDHHR